MGVRPMIASERPASLRNPSVSGVAIHPGAERLAITHSPRELEMQLGARENSSEFGIGDPAERVLDEVGVKTPAGADELECDQLARAQAALGRAQEALKADADDAEAQAALARAELRLQVAGANN